MTLTNPSATESVLRGTDLSAVAVQQTVSRPGFLVLLELDVLWRSSPCKRQYTGGTTGKSAVGGNDMTHCAVLARLAFSLCVLSINHFRTVDLY